MNTPEYILSILIPCSAAFAALHADEPSGYTPPESETVLIFDRCMEKDIPGALRALDALCAEEPYISTPSADALPSSFAINVVMPAACGESPASTFKSYADACSTASAGYMIYSAWSRYERNSTIKNDDISGIRTKLRRAKVEIETLKRSLSSSSLPEQSRQRYAAQLKTAETAAAEYRLRLERTQENAFETKNEYVFREFLKRKNIPPRIMDLARLEIARVWFERIFNSLHVMTPENARGPALKITDILKEYSGIGSDRIMNWNKDKYMALACIFCGRAEESVKIADSALARRDVTGRERCAMLLAKGEAYLMLNNAQEAAKVCAELKLQRIPAGTLRESSIRFLRRVEGDSAYVPGTWK